MVLRFFFTLLLFLFAACSDESSFGVSPRDNPWDPNGINYSRAICGDSEYNPKDVGVSCSDGVLYLQCGEQWYNSSSERCNNNSVEKRCGDDWYNEKWQQCIDGAVKSKIILSENFENGLFEWSTLISWNNLWTSGSAAGTPDNSSKAAYISSDGTNYDYYTYYTISSRAHLYKKIVFPPSQSNFTLTFDWKCVGDKSKANMHMYLVPVNVNIVNTSSPDYAYIIGKPGDGYFGQSTWTTESITLSAATYSGKQYNLVFYWYNAAECGYGCTYTGKSAAIDNVVIISN